MRTVQLMVLGIPLMSEPLDNELADKIQKHLQEKGLDGKEEEVWPNKLHPSHVTRISMDASSYDEICTNCYATDQAIGGWGELAKPCPKAPAAVQTS